MTAFQDGGNPVGAGGSGAGLEARSLPAYSQA